MRIMHVESGRHLYGGAEQVRYLIQGLAARGIENVLVCPRDSGIATVTLADEVVALPMRGDLDAGLAVRLKRAMQAHSPSVVHVHSRRGADSAGGWAARTAGVPAVLTRRVDAREPGPWARLKYRPYRAVVAISRAVRKELLRAGLEPGRVFTVPSAVDAGRCSESGAREHLTAALELPAGARLIGVVAQLIPRKGHGLLLECLPDLLARHPEALVLCFGRGRLQASLARRIKALGLESRVRLAGFRTDLPEILPGLDLLVHPAEREGLGVAVLEAMSAGVPVVVSDAGGLTDLVEHEVHGLVFRRGDRRGLAAAVARILDEPALGRRLAAAAGERTRAEFSVERMSRRYLEIYNRVSAES